MSLLNNLLSFSFAHQSNFSWHDDLQSPNRSNSVSLNNRYNKQKQQHSVQPMLMPESKNSPRQKCKSLNKILYKSVAPKMDPKQRCLHRVAQTLSRKIRKQYYAFFVTLQTIKKQEDNNKNNSINQTHRNQYQQACSKIQQVLSLHSVKLYESSFKNKTFKSIRKWAQLRNFANKLFQIFNKRQKLICSLEFFQYMKKNQNSFMRFQILCKTFQTIQNKIDINNKRKVLNYLKQLQIESNELEIKDAFQTPKKPKKTSYFFEQNKNDSKQICQTAQTLKSMNSLQYREKINSIVNRDTHLNKKDRNSQKSLDNKVSIAKNIKLRIQTQTIDWLSPNLSMVKSNSTLQLQDPCLNLNEQINQIGIKQNLPLAFIKLLPQELQIQQIGDIYDKSEIFCDMYQVTGISRICIGNNNGDNMQGKIFNKNQHEKFFGSKVTSKIFYSPIQPLNNSLQSEDNIFFRAQTPKAESSFCFGQAVKFKNSLLRERHDTKIAIKDFPHKKSKAVSFHESSRTQRPVRDVYKKDYCVVTPQEFLNRSHEGNNIIQYPVSMKNNPPYTQQFKKVLQSSPRPYFFKNQGISRRKSITPINQGQYQRKQFSKFNN